MKRKIKRNKTEKLSISLGHGMTSWLRELADANEVGNVSSTIRDLLQPIYKDHMKMQENRSKYGINEPDKKD